MQKSGDSLLIRLYRCLVTLYPAAFREEFGVELVETAREREREGRRNRLFSELILDVFSTAPKQHMYMFKQDFRHAARLLRRSPSFTLTAILVLALGTGATTAVFSIVNAVLLRPLPFSDPRRLAVIEESSAPQGVDRMGPAWPNLADYAQQSRTFEQMAAFSEAGFTLTGAGEPERVEGARITWNLFQTLGVAPVMGRHFLREEDQPKIETAVMLSYGLWQRRFAGDPHIVGATIHVNGAARTVAGVMPRGFRFPETAEIWTPLSINSAHEHRTNHYLIAVGRLRAGVTVKEAETDLKSVLAGIQARFPDATAELGVHATPITERMTGEYRPALIKLLLAVGLVLAIACTNIMNLLLARAAGRTREVAIRIALGANRRRVIRQMLTESLLLGAIGGLAGFALGIVGVKALVASAPVELPYWVQVEPDVRVLAFAAAATLASVMLFGLVPALRASTLDPARGTNELRRGVSAGLGAGRLRQGLVAAQVALSVVLLVGAGLMIRSFLKLQEVRLGFDGRHVLTCEIGLPSTRYPEAAQRNAFYARLRERLAAVPGVRSVATASGLPTVGGWWRTLQRKGQASIRPADLPTAYHVLVSPGYFATMGIPVRRGREFTGGDGPRAPVVILSEKMARQLWPDGEAIGQLVRIDPFLPEEPWRRVVGVTGDVSAEGARRPAPGSVYVPEQDMPVSRIAVLLKSDMRPEALIQAARSAIKEIDPEIPMYRARALTSILSESNWQFRFYTFLFAAFAALAMLLAGVGLSGIMAHVVIERTHEIGIRLAIGATARDLVGMVLSKALLLIGTGAAVGTVLALVSTRVLATQLFEVKPYDPATILGVLFVLGAAGVGAAWLPARRAARVDPACALRWE